MPPGRSSSSSQAGKSAAPKPERPPATFVSYDPEAYGRIVHPNRFDWYLITRWLPDLGNDALAVVKVLRNELYYNPEKKALRDECEMSMEELARRSNMSRTKLFALFRENEALQKFVERQAQIKIKADRPHRDVNAFRVSMTDPIHPHDEEEYVRLLEQRGAEQLAAEARKRFRISRREDAPAVADSYEYKSGTHRRTMSAENPSYEYKSGTHRRTMNAESERHKEYSLPLEFFTKESLTPAADAPQHKCCPPEGDQQLAPHVGREAEEESLDPLTAVWQQALVTLSQLVNIPTFEAHLRPLRPVQQDADTLVLAAPSAFTLEWIHKRHEGHIREALEKALGRAINVEIILESK